MKQNPSMDENKKRRRNDPFAIPPRTRWNAETHIAPNICILPWRRPRWKKARKTGLIASCNHHRHILSS